MTSEKGIPGVGTPESKTSINSYNTVLNLYKPDPFVFEVRDNMRFTPAVGGVKLDWYENNVDVLHAKAIPVGDGLVWFSVLDQQWKVTPRPANKRVVQDGKWRVTPYSKKHMRMILSFNKQYEWHAAKSSISMYDVINHYNAVPIVWTLPKCDGQAFFCPFCGRWHRHGYGAGHRVAHCHNGTWGGYVIALTPPDMMEMIVSLIREVV